MDAFSASILAYITIGVLTLIVTFFLVRWFFAINQQLKNQETIIELLKLIVKKEEPNN